MQGIRQVPVSSMRVCSSSTSFAYHLASVGVVLEISPTFFELPVPGIP